MVWRKSYEANTAIATGYQQMRDGTLQKLGIWKYNRVLKGHNVTYKTVPLHRKQQEVAVHPYGQYHHAVPTCLYTQAKVGRIAANP